MAFGDIIPASSVDRSVAIANRLGPRDAMAMTLAAYLLRLEFRVDGVDDRDTVFSLRQAFNQWPDARQDLPYPCVSIVDAAPLGHVAHNLVPTVLEETWGEFDHLVYGSVPGSKRTVLFKESGAIQEFQVDFWTDKIADRQAIAARLPSAFSPGEARTGVVVEGPALYYSRKVRLTLTSSTYDDSAANTPRNERRLRAEIIGECDIVSLRTATETKQPMVCKTVIDPGDPEDEESSE